MRRNFIPFLFFLFIAVIGVTNYVKGTSRITVPDVPLASNQEGQATAAGEPLLLSDPYIASEPRFVIPMPNAPGTAVKANETAIIDYSNASDGYVMVKYFNSTANMLVTLINAPDGTEYTYILTPGSFAVYPLSVGNGSYTIGVYEQTGGTRFRLIIKETIDVALRDSFAPFIRPNQYVNYNQNSVAVKKAHELTANATGVIQMITAVYNYVVTNFTYDKEFASTVQFGYLPDVDAVLARKKGICFDYTAVMTAMLRSQGIPTQLVVGYLGNEYHAWVRVYSKEEGWVNVIFFDGNSWRLMDPTFAAGRLDFAIDESQYKAIFRY